jgi:hypothetical protein
MGVVDLFAWHVDGHQRKVTELYWCSLCDIALNATVHAEHLDGSKPMGVVGLELCTPAQLDLDFVEVVRWGTLMSPIKAWWPWALNSSITMT